MAIIKQGILGGFKKKIGSVVGSSWKGKSTMRSLPLSVANPKTAAQVSNRNRFKACAEFASIILAALIKPLMDRFAGQMSGYNMFTKLNKEVFADPTAPDWGNLILSKGRLLPPELDGLSPTTTSVGVQVLSPTGDRYALPTDKVFALVVRADNSEVLYQGDTGKVRTDSTFTLEFSNTVPSGKEIFVYLSYLRADNTEVSTSAVLGEAI